jgi:crotonobetainyl-CoA:carnitine CoA-transferase CaiB-like acyl-CoA transferase
MPPPPSGHPARPHSELDRPLAGIRVLEIADEQAEYCGLLLAGLGAEVTKVESPLGSPTRRLGPHFQGPGDAKSLYFWHYNRGKRSLVINLDELDGRKEFLDRLDDTDILLQSVSASCPDRTGLGDADLSSRFPSLIRARVTPFGDDGPWAGYQASDLIHLALGGVLMNCGYDPEPDGRYDLAPVAPQMWHSYHIVGEQLTIAILTALWVRKRTGLGQNISISVHQAVSTATELDTMSWVMRMVGLHRHTCRHSSQSLAGMPTISMTKDGRWYMCFLRGPNDERRLDAFLANQGFYEDDRPAISVSSGLDDRVPGSDSTSETKTRMTELATRYINRFTYDRVPWREAEEAGVLMVPLRKPHENLTDVHWQARATYAPVFHPELGRSLLYPVRKWLSNVTTWEVGGSAPELGGGSTESPQANSAIASPLPDPVLVAPAVRDDDRQEGRLPLAGVRIFDFGWFLATAGGTRFLAALGAECIKVEWKGNPDSRTAAMAPVGGRAARDRATGPLEGETDPDMGGQFNNKNTGKLGISLNIKHPKGLELAKRLIASSDVVTDGFSAGVMESWGLGYENMTSLRPDIIYVKQSGFGVKGSYGRYRMFGPTAASISGLSEMSGLREPAMPAGWGYSYLDWIAAYTFAQAILSALYYREVTGNGQFIDSSQCESGLSLCGTALLDWQLNGTSYRRTGNRSPYKPAAPHGVYRTGGSDRWIAIACFDEEQWSNLVRASGRPEWSRDPRFRTLAERIAHQDALDIEMSSWCRENDGYALMRSLQDVGVPAGVCQTAQDKCESDPQLSHLGWLTEVTGSKIGTWPVVDLPFSMSHSSHSMSGITGRGAPAYGEDNHYVLGKLLGLTSEEIDELAREGVI